MSGSKQQGDILRNLLRFLTLSVALGTMSALPAQAADPIEQHNSTAFWFVNWIGLKNASLNIVDPTGKKSTIYAASGTPVFELDRANTVDGVYRYELTAATEQTQAIANPQNNGRGDAASETAAVPFYLTGQFVVSRGVITTPDTMTEDDN